MERFTLYIDITDTAATTELRFHMATSFSDKTIEIARQLVLKTPVTARFIITSTDNSVRRVYLSTLPEDLIF